MYIQCISNVDTRYTLSDPDRRLKNTMTNTIDNHQLTIVLFSYRMTNQGSIMNKASDLALYVLEHTGSVLGKVSRKMTAQQQRELFGVYLGKGLIVVDGEQEIVYNQVKVCFGQDYDNRNITRWNVL